MQDIGSVCLHGKEVEYLMLLDHHNYDVIHPKLRDAHLQLSDSS